MERDPRDRREPLERLADAIGDGRPLDEHDTGSLPGGTDASLVDNLMALSRIRQAHRVAEAESDVAPAAGEDGVRRWGPLLLLERLGGGAFGEVWRAWDERLHRPVALKLLRDDDGGRLLDEGRLLAKVEHPGVARVLAADVHDDRPGLAMELVDGPTLGDRREASGPLPAAEVARIGAALADALAAVHAAGVAHGDVKPRNVVLAEGDRPVLVDFGSGARGGRSPGDRLTGTPAYLAPERRAGAEPASPAADVWALAAVLEELAGGPATLPAAVGRAKAEDPAARPSAREVADALAAAAPVGGIDGRAEPERPSRRRRVPAVALVTALVVLASAVVTLVRMTGPSAPIGVEARMLRGSGPFDPLSSGSAVAAGDLLQLELRLDEEAWVYVLNGDDRGSRALLFPLPGYEQQNPLPAGDTVLPGRRTGAADPVAWTLGEASVETFLVVATREPLRELEREIARLPAPGDGSGALAHALDDEALEHVYRGVTGVARVQPGPSPVRDPGDRVFDLVRSVGQPDDVRVIEIVLPHADARE